VLTLSKSAWALFSVAGECAAAAVESPLTDTLRSLSHLTPEHGLIADNVMSYTIVLPSGELVTAVSGGDYADLWWALKGSTNQMGIVVNYKLLTKDVGEWWGGLLTFLPTQVDAFVDAVAGERCVMPGRASLISCLCRV
jgi:FAD/FMN-containing dehydrogenase